MNTSLPLDSVQGLVLVDQLVAGVIDPVDREMRGQPASTVVEMLPATLPSDLRRCGEFGAQPREGAQLRLNASEYVGFA